VAYGNRSVNPKAIRFDKNTFFLEPCKKVTVVAVEFDVAESLVAQHVASDAYVRLVLLFDSNGRRYFKKLFKSFFACRKRVRSENELLIIV